MKKWPLDFYQKLVSIQMAAIFLMLSSGVGLLLVVNSRLATLIAYRQGDIAVIQANTTRITALEEWRNKQPIPDPNRYISPQDIIKPDQRLKKR